MQKLKEENQALKAENERLNERMNGMQEEIDKLDSEFLPTVYVSLHILNSIRTKNIYVC